MQRPSRSKRASARNNGSTSSTEYQPSGKKNDLQRVSLSSMMFFFVVLTATSILVIGWNAPLSQEIVDNRSRSTSQREKLRKKEQTARKRGNIVTNGQDKTRVSSNNGPLSEATPEFDRDGKTKLHLVFSTDCSGYQHWQSYLLFHSALRVKQPGHVTRIASGCNETQAKEAQEWHDKHVKGVMSDRFGLHLTPKFDTVTNEKGEKTGKNYKFFNKPHGLLHWLEHGEGMGVNPATGKLYDEDVVVILTDPDMILLRPIGADLNSKDDIMFFSQDKQAFRVEHGKPAAQRFGYASSWLNLNMTRIAGKDSPVHNVSRVEGGRFYPAGPPYVATGKDMYTVGKKWSEFVPESYADHPHLMAEMYAYSIAAAHLELPHQLVDSHMVSDTGSKEGFPLIKDIPDEDVCKVVQNHVQGKDTSHPMPSTIHYCQRYIVGRHFFGKHKQPHDFFSCSKPLMEVPPADIATQYDYGLDPQKHKKFQLREGQAHKEAFMICGIVAALNEAASFFKRHHCGAQESKTRWDKSLDLTTLF